MLRGKVQPRLLKKVLVEPQLKIQYINAYNMFLLNLYNLSNIPINNILTTIKQCYKYAPQKASFKYNALFDYLDILYTCKENNISLNQEHQINLKNTCLSLKKSPIFMKLGRTSQMKIQLIINRLEKKELTKQFSQLSIK